MSDEPADTNSFIIDVERVNFPARLIAAREARRLSQAGVAEMLGVTRSAVSFWEAGKALPKPGHIKALATGLGVALGWLLTGDGDGGASALPDEIDSTSARRENFGKRVSMMREARDLAQEDIARTLGVTRAAVWQWENGKSFPRNSYIEWLAHVLHVRVGWLLTGEGERELTADDEALGPRDTDRFYYARLHDHILGWGVRDSVSGMYVGFGDKAISFTMSEMLNGRRAAGTPLEGWAKAFDAARNGGGSNDE